MSRKSDSNSDFLFCAVFPGKERNRYGRHEAPPEEKRGGIS